MDRSPVAVSVAAPAYANSQVGNAQVVIEIGPREEGACIITTQLISGLPGMRVKVTYQLGPSFFVSIVLDVDLGRTDDTLPTAVLGKPLLNATAELIDSNNELTGIFLPINSVANLVCGP